MDQLTTRDGLQRADAEHTQRQQWQKLDFEKMDAVDAQSSLSPFLDGLNYS